MGKSRDERERSSYISVEEIEYIFGYDE